MPELREFSTMSDDLEALATWLAEGCVTHVAMESTGRLLATDPQYPGRSF